MGTTPKKKITPPVRHRHSIARFLLLSGWICIGSALFILVLTFYPVVREEIGYTLHANLVKTASEKIQPIDTNFGIVIPKLGANAKVVGQVDPYDSNQYQQALTRGVAHAKGTSLPGQPGNVFLFSHSSVDFYVASRYNSIFYLLHKLEAKDTILVYYQNAEYTYEVKEKKLVEANAIEYLTKQTNDQILTLMTCWPPGTTMKRLVITAQLTRVVQAGHTQ